MWLGNSWTQLKNLEDGIDQKIDIQAQDKGDYLPSLDQIMEGFLICCIYKFIELIGHGGILRLK